MDAPRSSPTALNRRTVIGGILPLASATAARAAHLPSLTALLPRASDIIVSLRNTGNLPPEEFLRNAEICLNTYRPNRVEWHYLSSSKSIRDLKSKWGIKYIGATINANAPIKSDEGLARDFDGKAIVAPWMRAPGWNARWITVASEQTRDVLLSQIDNCLTSGADGLQVDDGWFQWVAEMWGAGDFSEASIKGFGPWLATHISPIKLRELKITANPDFNFRAWLQNTHGIHNAAEYRRRREGLPGIDLWRRYLAKNVLQFWTEMRAHVRAQAPRAPISGNLGLVRPDETFIGLSGYMDYTVSELPVDREPSAYALWGATAEAVSLPFVACFSGRTSDKRYRHLISAAFSSGINPAAPWDVFVPNIGEIIQPRHSPDPAAFADLYDFVRKHRRLIDGWRGAGNIAVVVPVAAYSNSAVVSLSERLVNAQVPFVILPTDSEYCDLAPRLAGIKTLALAQPRAKYSLSTLKIISQSGLAVLTAEQLDPRWLTGQSVGLLTGTPGWRLSTRCMVDNSRKWIVHVTPSLAGASIFKGSVTFHRSGQYKLSPRTRLRVFLPNLEQMTMSPSSVSTQTIVYQIPEIADWAILEPTD